jgi:hypothetical protein
MEVAATAVVGARWRRRRTISGQRLGLGERCRRAAMECLNSFAAEPLRYYVYGARRRWLEFAVAVSRISVGSRQSSIGTPLRAEADIGQGLEPRGRSPALGPRRQCLSTYRPIFRITTPP